MACGAPRACTHMKTHKHIHACTCHAHAHTFTHTRTHARTRTTRTTMPTRTSDILAFSANANGLAQATLLQFALRSQTLFGETVQPISFLSFGRLATTFTGQAASASPLLQKGAAFSAARTCLLTALVPSVGHCSCARPFICARRTSKARTHCVSVQRSAKQGTQSMVYAKQSMALLAHLASAEHPGLSMVPRHGAAWCALRAPHRNGACLLLHKMVVAPHGRCLPRLGVLPLVNAPPQAALLVTQCLTEGPEVSALGAHAR